MLVALALVGLYFQWFSGGHFGEGDGCDSGDMLVMMTVCCS
jgi:hypothetical protein